MNKLLASVSTDLDGLTDLHGGSTEPDFKNSIQNDDKNHGSVKNSIVFTSDLPNTKNGEK